MAIFKERSGMITSGLRALIVLSLALGYFLGRKSVAEQTARGR